DEDRRSRSRRRAPPAGVRAVAREARRAGGAPLQAPGRRRGRGEASRGVPRQASGRRPDGGGAAGLPRWQAPELHGAFGVRQPADPPADRRGQARSCGAAGTGAFPPSLGETYVAPRTPLEAALAEIWSEFLDLDEVGVYDNFFDLGGDSILSLRISAQARAVGIELDPHGLFAHQTIAETAARIAAGGEQP